MSNKLESIKSIISMNDSHILSEEAVIETIRHIISPEKDQAKVAVQRPGSLDFVVGCKRCKYPLDQCKCYKNDIQYLSKGDSKLKSNYKLNGLYTPDLSSGSILSFEETPIYPTYGKNSFPTINPETFYKENVERVFSKERSEPSELVLIEYSSPERLGLPEHARGVLEMIEAEEYRIFKEYSETKNDWARICYIDEDDNEVIEWVDLTNGPVDDKVDEYEKFLRTAVAEVSNEKNKENVVVEGRDEVVVLKDLFNLHVAGVDE